MDEVRELLMSRNPELLQSLESMLVLGVGLDEEGEVATPKFSSALCVCVCVTVCVIER